MARGSIRKRGDRRWQLCYDLPRLGDGKRIQRWETVDGTKKQAEARLTEILDSLRRASYFEPTTMTLGEYLDMWLRDYAEVSVRPTTLHGYRRIVESGIKPVLGGMKLCDLSAREVQAYYGQMTRRGVSAQTVIHHHRVLRQALTQAVRWDLILRNATDGVKPPKRERPRFKALTPADAKRLIDAARNTDYRVPIHLALASGLRRSEILGLRWSDVDWDGSTLTVARAMVGLVGNPLYTDSPKSQRSRRSVSIGETTLSLLVAHQERRKSELKEQGIDLDPDRQLCVRPDGTDMKPNALSHGYARIAKRCGIEGVRFHDLRHAHATMLLESGVPVHVVQARLGHESIQTTVDIYGHVLPSSDEAAGRAAEHALLA